MLIADFAGVKRIAPQSTRHSDRTMRGTKTIGAALEPRSLIIAPVPGPAAISSLSASARSGKMLEGFDHFFVYRPLERNDQFGETADLFPSPGVEFRPLTARWGIDIDLGILALKAEREPFLALP